MARPYVNGSIPRDLPSHIPTYSAGHEYSEVTNLGHLHQGDYHVHHYYAPNSKQWTLPYADPLLTGPTNDSDPLLNAGDAGHEDAYGGSAAVRDQSHKDYDGRNPALEEAASSWPVFLVPYARNPQFVVRSAEWQWLTSLFFSSTASFNEDQSSQKRLKSVQNPKAAFYGLSGAGKTQLAIELAHEHRRQKPEYSIFWIHASSPEWLQQGFERVAEACGMKNTSSTSCDVVALVAAWLKSRSDKPWLLILDNADDADIFEPRARLAELIEDCPQGSVLMTTQNRKAAEKIMPDGHVFHLNEMTPLQSAVLLDRTMNSKQTSHNMTAVSNVLSVQILTAQLGNLPLAVAQAGAFIKENRIHIDDYLTAWQRSSVDAEYLLAKEFTTNGRQRVDTTVPNAVANTIMMTFDSIQSQRPRAGEMLIQISFYFPNAINPSLLLMPSETEHSPGFLEAIGDLQAFSLLETAGQNAAYDMHNLIYQILQIWRTTKLDVSIVHKVTEQTFSTLCKAFPTCAKRAERQAADAFLPHVLNFLDKEEQMQNKKPYGTRVKQDRIKLMRRVAEHLLYQGRTTDARSLRQSIVGLCEADFDTTSPEVIRARCELAQVLQRLRLFKMSKSILLEIVEHFEACKTPSRAFINSLKILSKILAEERHYAEALVYAREAKQVSSAYLGSEDEETLILDFTIAEILRAFASHDSANSKKLLETAKETLEKALRALSQRCGGDASSTLLGKQYLSDILDELGEFEGSKRLCMEIVVAKQRMLGAQHFETFQTRFNLALCLINQSQLDDAEDMIKDCLSTISSTIDEHYLCRTRALQILANIYEKRAALERSQILEMETSIDAYIESARTLKSPSKLNIPDSVDEFLALKTKSIGLAETSIRPADKTTVWRNEAPISSRSSGQIANTTSSGGIVGMRYKAIDIQSYQCVFMKCEQTFDHMDNLRNHLTSAHKAYGLSSILSHYQKALEYKTEATECLLASLGVEHPYTLQHLIDTARCLLQLFMSDRDRFGDKILGAEKCLRQVLDVQTELYGSEGVDTMSTKELLVLIFQESDQLEKAQTLAEVVLRYYSTKLGKSHEQTLAMGQRLAEILYAMPGSENEAITLMRECYTLTRNAFGSTHTNTRLRELLYLHWVSNARESKMQSGSIGSKVSSDASYIYLDSRSRLTKMTPHQTLKFTAPPSSSRSGPTLFSLMMENRKASMSSRFQPNRRLNTPGFSARDLLV